MRASVVIPTCDRPDQLQRCLAALRGSTLDVIVVDDGLRLPAQVPAGVRLVQGARRGPAAARNTGIAEARGDVVLLLDDDCVPAPGWAEALSAPAMAGDLVGGIVAPGTTDRYVVATEALSRSVERVTGLVRPCNAALDRGLARRFRFDERFADAAGEDREWCARLVTAGVAVVREPRALVWHVPTVGPVAFWRRHVRYGVAAARSTRSGAGRPDLYREIVRAGFREGPVCGVLVLAAQAATAAGYARARCSASRVGR